MKTKQAAPEKRLFDNTIDTYIFVLLCAVLLAVPLFFNIKSHDQFELPKLTLLRILTCAMVFLWALKSFLEGKFTYRPTPLDIPLLGWVIMNVITTFTSFAPHLSFRGEYENFAGSLSNINYVILYWIAATFINSAEKVKFAAKTLLAAGFLTTIYAIAQFFGHDFIKWNVESMIKGRYFASMGNPNFLGALLIMIIPVNTAFFIIAAKNRKMAAAASLFILFILSYIALFGTQSRGPFLGFVFSMLVFIVYGLYSAFNKIKESAAERHVSAGAALAAMVLLHKKWIIAGLIALIVSAALSLTVGRQSTHRLWSSITDVSSSLKVSRLHIWVPAAKMIRDYPLLGTGVDTFKTMFPRYSGVEFAQIDGANVSSRTAHNELLNIAATQGLVSLGIYLLLIFSYILMWFRAFVRIQDPSIKLISLGLFSGFTAYFIQNIFSFGVAAINTSFYIFMAMHFMLHSKYCGGRMRSFHLFSPSSLLKPVMIVITAALLSALSVFAFRIYSADVNYNRGRIFGNVYNKWDVAVREHLESVKKAPNEVKYHVYLGLAYERYSAGLADTSARMGALLEAVKYYTSGASLNPGNAYYWGNLGRTYFTLFELRQDNSYAERAVYYYEQALERAPVTGLFYNNLIDIYLKFGIVDRALPLIDKLAVIDTDMASGAAFMAGNMFFSRKEFDRAIDYYSLAIKLRPDVTPAYHNLGVSAAAAGRPALAKEFLEKFLSLDPDSDMAKNAREILGKIGKSN
ncbi:MAG TPA: tetratricopeptide repeat protein [bacterium]|nr:tetratricopeptide repeat protein [bacterium]